MAFLALMFWGIGSGIVEGYRGECFFFTWPTELGRIWKEL